MKSNSAFLNESNIGLFTRLLGCVSRAYAVCWVTPNFWENALTDEKKKLGSA